MNLLLNNKREIWNFMRIIQNPPKIVLALSNLDLNVSNLRLALWIQCLSPAAGPYYFSDFFYAEVAYKFYAWFMKQNTLFTVQYYSADMRGHSVMHLEWSVGTGLNEQHATVYECAMWLLQKESRILRAQMKIVTNSSRLFAFICKHKDYIWLGNFGLNWKVQSGKK